MSQDGPIGHRVDPHSVPYLLLIASLALILSIVGYLLWVSHGRERLRFQGYVQKAVDEIERRVETRTALLRTAGGLTPAEFQNQVKTIEGTPGIHSIAYVKRTDDLTPTMRRARDDGVAAADDTVFQIYAPVYARGKPIGSVDDRRAALEGFVTATLDPDALLKDALGTKERDEISIVVGPASFPDHRWTDERTVLVAGQPWKLTFVAHPAFEANAAGGPVLLLLGAGLALSGAIFGISRAQVRARAAAERIAGRLVRSAEALGRSEERSRRMFETAMDAVVAIDIEGKIISWNEKASQMFGWSESEAMGRPAETIVPPRYRDAYSKGLAELRAAGGPASNRRFEVAALRRDGSEFPVELSITPIGVGEGTVFTGFIRDLTDRRAAEAEREGLLNRLLMQMERMPVACILTGPDFAIRFWNPAAQRVFGLAREEAMGRKLEELLAPKSREEGLAQFKAIAAGLTSSITTWESLARDGKTVLCEWHMGPLHESDGSFAGLQAMVIDTTERARLEAQLRHSQKMEAVGRLAGGIAHDFNNLLTTVSGYGEILLDQLKKDDPARDSVQEIRQAARRAADLTRQLLAFSRKQMREPSVLDLNEVLADMDGMLRRLIGEDIELRTSLDPQVGRVKADRSQVEQVVMNLVVNARDAMPKGGKLTIETRNVDIDPSYVRQHSFAKAGPHVLLAVSDTGGGIPPDVLPRIFEPFFTTKERGKGTGLGLATVYGIVKQSGGHIMAYSEPGRGAAFKVYLGRVDGKAEPKPAPAEPKEVEGGTETILVVEDEEPVRKLMTQILQRHGYTVIEAANGNDALAAISRLNGTIHLMVTDVVMPGMSGRELAQRVEPIKPGLKVLYVSGYTEDAIVHHGELDPGTPFLAKPFSPTALATKVRELLNAKA